MKKDYEKKELIIILSCIFIIFEIIIISISFIKKEYSYKLLNGIVLDKNIALFVIKEKNYFYKNSTLYNKDKKIKYKILEDKEIVLNDKEKYRQIKLKLKLNNYRINDSITVSLKNKKIKIYKLIKNIWDGD